MAFKSSHLSNAIILLSQEASLNNRDNHLDERDYTMTQEACATEIWPTLNLHLDLQLASLATN